MQVVGKFMFAVLRIMFAYTILECPVCTRTAQGNLIIAELLTIPFSRIVYTRISIVTCFVLITLLMNAL